MKWYFEQRLELLKSRLSPEERVLAVGRAAELRRVEARFSGISVSGPGEVLLVTDLRMLWVGGSPRWVTSLPFSLVQSFTEVTQGHRYALILSHDAIERLQWVPAHHVLWWSWGNAEAIRRPTRTILAFSGRDTEAARAIRAQCAANSVQTGESTSLPASERSRMVLETVSASSRSFIDPLPALKAEYARAVESLRQEVGAPRTLLDHLRLRRRERRLYRKLVVKPAKWARW